MRGSFGATLAIAVAVTHCGPRPQAPAAPAAAPLSTTSALSAADVERAVGAMLDDWHAAAAAADEQRYFGHFTENAIFMGTDATERWDLAAFRSYASPHFARGKAWTFRSVRRAVIVGTDGSIAWFDEDLETENLGPARGSGVARLVGGEWKIAHYNLAITVPNDRFDAVKRAAAGESGALSPPTKAPDPESGKLVPGTGACSTDADCVPAECCHATTCTARSERPQCANVMCTRDCRAGTMDCGQGSCLCHEGRCAAQLSGRRDRGRR